MDVITAIRFYFMCTLLADWNVQCMTCFSMWWQSGFPIYMEARLPNVCQSTFPTYVLISTVLMICGCGGLLGYMTPESEPQSTCRFNEEKGPGMLPTVTRSRRTLAMTFTVPCHQAHVYTCWIAAVLDRERDCFGSWSCIDHFIETKGHAVSWMCWECQAERISESYTHTHVLAYWAGGPCCLSCTKPGVFCASGTGENQCSLQESAWFCVCDGSLCVDACLLR